MGEGQFDYAKLRGKIREVCSTQAIFARSMGMSMPAVSARLHNHRSFTAREIRRACAVLGIEDHDIPEYFFKLEVQKT